MKSTQFEITFPNNIQIQLHDMLCLCLKNQNSKICFSLVLWSLLTFHLCSVKTYNKTFKSTNALNPPSPHLYFSITLNLINFVYVKKCVYICKLVFICVFVCVCLYACVYNPTHPKRCCHKKWKLVQNIKIPQISLSHSKWLLCFKPHSVINYLSV